MQAKARVTVIRRAMPDHEFPQSRQSFDLLFEAEAKLTDQQLTDWFKREYPKATSIEIERFQTNVKP